jgi:hypothetical protein
MMSEFLFVLLPCSPRLALRQFLRAKRSSKEKACRCKDFLAEFSPLVGLGNLEIGKPAPNFLKNLSKTGGLSLQDAACANFAKEKSEA